MYGFYEDGRHGNKISDPKQEIDNLYTLSQAIGAGQVDSIKCKNVNDSFLRINGISYFTLEVKMNKKSSGEKIKIPLGESLTKDQMSYLQFISQKSGVKFEFSKPLALGWRILRWSLVATGLLAALGLGIVFTGSHEKIAGWIKSKR